MDKPCSGAFIATALLLAFALTGCRPRPVKLTGTYGVRRNKIVEPVLKVEQTKTGYEFEERTVGEWQVDPENPHVATADEVREWLGNSVSNAPVFGLATKTAILLKVPSGWSSAQLGHPLAGESTPEIVTKSGYLLVSSGELFAAQKVELSGR